MREYIISVDQSTQGTKALLFDHEGKLIFRTDIPHRQIINEAGWVSHDPEEIYGNTIKAVRALVEGSGIDKSLVAGMGISNQRETTLVWDRTTGAPLADAIVWQCARAAEICNRPEIAIHAEKIRRSTGLQLSPYFPAAKLAWLLEHVKGVREKMKEHSLGCGTVDAYLVYRLTKGASYRTDASNASRTQLFNIHELKWDAEICRLFGIEPEVLPEVTDSDACFGMTDCEGVFDEPIPIHAVLGDSHAALFGQGCHRPGMMKATYGTGSSIMMHIGKKPILSGCGLVTSLAWSRQGAVDYVLEGNLNYTGAVISWLKDDMGMIASPDETEALAGAARQDDALYLVPAFTGLGAPYWDSQAKAAIVGIDRTTGRKELVRAGLECIAYQILDIIRAMEKDAGLKIEKICGDGGPTHNRYLMQFQSDIAGRCMAVPDAEELSGIGAAYMAGISLGIWDESVLENLHRKEYTPVMEAEKAGQKYLGWQQAVASVLSRNEKFS